MKRLVLLLGFIGLSIALNAQLSGIMGTGKSGLGVTGGYVMGKGFTGNDVEVGISIKSLFDVEMDFLNVDFNEDRAGLIRNDAFFGGYTGKVTWWMFRKPLKSDFDIEFGLSTAYDNYKYHSYQYYESDVIIPDVFVSYYAGRIGLVADASYNFMKNWFVMPGLTSYYQYGKEKHREATVPVENNFSGMIGSVELTLGAHVMEMNTLYITASYVINSTENGSHLKGQIGYIVSF